MRIPTGTSSIDAAWLDEVLPPSVRDGGRVVGVEAEVIGEGVGLMGEVARLRVTYEGAGPRAVTTMISKVPTSNESMKAVGNAFGLYRKEYGFYQHAAHAMTISIPTAYVNLGDHDAGDYILLMEDMSPRRNGNQLESCSTEEAVLVLRELATLHAAWWEHPALDGFHEWLPGFDDPYWTLARGLYQDSVGRLRVNCAGLLSESVLQLAEVVADRYDESRACGAFRRPHTFVHGDFRLDNMMFLDSHEGTSLTLLDWQLSFKANPLWDVTYFIVGSFEPDWRRQHQDELLRVYHDALLANGVSGFSFEECEENYQACGLVMLAYLVTLGGDGDPSTMNERGRTLWELMVRRYGTAVDDFDCGRFLDSPR